MHAPATPPKVRLPCKCGPSVEECRSHTTSPALEALYAAGRPVSAEQIATGLAGRLPRSDLASVYRNLETLEQVGLIRHCHLGHGPGLYVPTGIEEREYLVCDSCSAVTPVEPSELDAVRTYIKKRFGYEARFSHFAMVGLCPECVREGKDR